MHVKAVLEGGLVEGYVSQDFVEPFAFAPDPSVPLPKKGELTPTSAADSAELLFRVNDTALNLRKKPEADKDGHIIARLPRGHLVTRLAVVKDAPLWWEVSTIVEGESLRFEQGTATLSRAPRSVRRRDSRECRIFADRYSPHERDGTGL